MKKRRILFITVGFACLVFTVGLLSLVLASLPDEAPLSAMEATNAPKQVVVPELIQRVPPEVAQPVTAATAFALKTGIREAELFGGGKTSYLSLMLVSSGDFDTLMVNQHPVDVLYAYLLTKNGVVRLPVALGFRDGEDYYALSGSTEAFIPVVRSVALEEFRQGLPKGQTFGLYAQQVSYKNGVDRSNCSADWAPVWCELAKDYNQSFGEAERQFVSRIITDKSWMPVGWLISLYPAEDPQFSQIISLP